MKLAEYLESRGAQAELARALNVSPVLVHQWATTRPVPIPRVLSIEKATNGEVTRQDLRPDDWQDIWPDYIPERRRAPGRRESDKQIGRRTRKPAP